MDAGTSAEKRPVMGYWQTMDLIGLLDAFYGDEKNRKAFEKWEKERKRERRAAKKAACT